MSSDEWTRQIDEVLAKIRPKTKEEEARVEKMRKRLSESRLRMMAKIAETKGEMTERMLPMEERKKAAEEGAARAREVVRAVTASFDEQAALIELIAVKTHHE